MKRYWEYDLPLPFPVLPSTISATLEPGDPHRVGMCVVAYPDKPHSVEISFFEIHLRTGHVVHASVSVPFWFTYEMRLAFDLGQNRWWCEISYPPDDQEKLNFYEIVPADPLVWREASPFQEEYYTQLRCPHLWIHDHKLHFVTLILDDDERNDHAWYWVTRDALPSLPGESRRFLGLADGLMAYPFGGMCLLVVLQRVLDAPPSDSFLRVGSGHWEWSYRLLAQDGSLIHQESLPQLTRPIVHSKYPESDFWKAFHKQVRILPGPVLEHGSRETCVAVIIHHVFEESVQHSLEMREKGAQELPASQAGLFWIDQDGQLLQSFNGFFGSEVSLCYCENQVIGASLLEGRWHLWSWKLGKETSRSSGKPLPGELKNVSLVAGKRLGESKEAFFWCIEEYSDLIRVTQRSCEQLEERSATEIEHLTLVRDLSQKFPFPKVVLEEDGLVLLGMDRENHLKLLYFQDDEWPVHV